jgi:hypothetical protein
MLLLQYCALHLADLQNTVMEAISTAATGAGAGTGAAARAGGSGGSGVDDDDDDDDDDGGGGGGDDEEVEDIVTMATDPARSIQLVHFSELPSVVPDVLMRLFGVGVAGQTGVTEGSRLPPRARDDDLYYTDPAGGRRAARLAAERRAVLDCASVSSKAGKMPLQRQGNATGGSDSGGGAAGANDAAAEILGDDPQVGDSWRWVAGGGWLHTLLCRLLLVGMRSLAAL